MTDRIRGAQLTSNLLCIALQKLRCSADIDDDIEEMRSEDRSSQHEQKVNDLHLICAKSLLLSIFFL